MRINGLERNEGKGIEFMMDYNLVDVYGLVGLDNRFNVVKNQAGRAAVSVSPIEDGIQASKLHDHAKLTEYQNRYSFDTKYQEFRRTPIQGKERCENKFTISLEELERQAQERTTKDVHYKTLRDIGKIGGFVPVPLGRGIYKWVAVIDFHKFYPNMIKSTNAGIVSAIDLDWYDDEEVVDKNGNRWLRNELIETPIGFFRKDVKALNSEVFDKWLKLRKEAQQKAQNYIKKYGTTETDEYKLLDNNQFSIKAFTNAGFGVFGLPIDRTFSQFVFNSCTVSCQDVIMFSSNVVREAGWEIIGGDTDSLFVDLESNNVEDAIKEATYICEMVNSEINKYLDEVYNIQEHTIEIGLETISKKFYVDTKKRYIKYNVYDDGSILKKPELEIKGLDLKKRATSQLAADLQEELFEILIKEEDPLPKMKDYLFELNKKLEDMPWAYVCKHGALNKYLDDYPEGTESAVAARNSLKYMDRYYEPGSNPFVGVFSSYPNHYNGKFVTERKGEFKMSFNEEDEQELKEAGFRLDWDEIRRGQIHLKTEHLLGMFNTDFYNIIEEMDQGDFLLI